MNRYLSLGFLVATVVVNALANALPINGLTTGEISNRFEVYFTPAGYVFSIWGMIYLVLLVFAIYQLLPGQRHKTLYDHIAPAFCLSCCANMAWIVLWHYQFFALTLIAMLGLLGCLIRIWLETQENVTANSTDYSHIDIAPFSLYLGWICVAVLANLAVVLEVYELRPFNMDAQSWGIASLCAGVLLAAAVTHLYQDLIFLAVFIWAYVGIVIRHNGTGSVAAAAIIGLSFMLIYGLWVAARTLALARHPS